MRKFVLLAVLSAFLIAPAATVADDLLPPWWRGQERTTSQMWEFDIQQNNPIQPDRSPDLGKPWLDGTEVWVFPGTCVGGWLEEDEGRFGVWQLSGLMDVLIQNFPDHPENEKWMWLQLTWRPQVVGAEPIFNELPYWPLPIDPPQVVEEIDLGMGWIHSTYEWKYDWNPPDEMFNFVGDINVDELVVDTWCIPEPGTIASLIGLGLTVGLIYWRRRK